MLGIGPSLHAPEARVLPVYYIPWCRGGDLNSYEITLTSS